jgi:hypothetical protein
MRHYALFCAMLGVSYIAARPNELSRRIPAMTIVE